MMHRLVHRGPDAEGMYVCPDGHGVLGHTRLSIMDPKGGDQPIYCEDGSKAIIANGEIYNFHGLRPAFSRQHIFSTTSDSEVILHLYEDHGSSAVRHLDGMFTFAIADGSEIMVARDRIQA